MASGYVVQYGAGQQHLVPGVAQDLERVVHRVLAAVGDKDLRGLADEPGIAHRLRAIVARRSGSPLRASNGGSRVRAASIAAATIGRRREIGLAAPKPIRLARGPRALALASTARVADSAMAAMRAEMRGLEVTVAIMTHGLPPGPARLRPTERTRKETTIGPFRLVVTGLP